MSESHLDKIRDLIGLTLGLCISEGLEKFHRAAGKSLEALTQSAEIRNNLTLSSLHLWTFCSRQSSSSAVVLGDHGHLLIDGFQLDKLSYLLQALTRSPDNRTLAVILPAMLSEAYFNNGNITFANRVMDLSISAVRRFPDAISVLYGDERLDFQHDVQRIFVIGHEIGHFFLSRQGLAEQKQRAQIIQTRLEHAIQHVMPSLSEQETSKADAWRLIGNDERFRDELFCDTIGVEMVEASVAAYLAPGSPASALAFEAIYFTALGLDLLRTLRLVPAADRNVVDEAADELLGREFIRGVCLNLLAQSRFFATQVQVERMVERVRQMQSDAYGLGHVLAAVEEMSRHTIGEPVSDDSLRARLEQIYHWESDPTALKTRQIY